MVPAGSSGEPAPTSGTWSLVVPSGLDDARAQASYDFITWMLEKEQQEAFREAGGIPTRDDVLSGADEEYLQAVSDSMSQVRQAVRYVFSSAMLEATESSLSEIGAGNISVAAGLDGLQDRLMGVVREAGLLQ